MTRQYKAVFFDLYGTLIDIRTDEDSRGPGMPCMRRCATPAPSMRVPTA